MADVNAIAPDGEEVTLPAENAEAATAAGFKVFDPKAWEQYQLSKSLDSAPGMAKSFGLGAASMVPGAVPALIGSGAVLPQTAQALREANPGSYLGGQVAGVVGPALASGGASAEAEGAAALGEGAAAAPSIMGQVAKVLPTNLLSKGGEAVEGAVTRAAGEGLTGQVLGGAARGALEAPAYAINDELNESYIQDKPFTAEALVGSIGPSALFGGVLGGGMAATLGIGAEYAPKAFRRASEALDALAEKTKPAEFEAPAFAAPAASDVIPGVEVPAGPAAVEAPASRSAPAPFQAKPLPDAAGGARALRSELTSARQQVEAVKEQLFREDKPRIIQQLLGDRNESGPLVKTLLDDAATTLDATGIKSANAQEVRRLLTEGATWAADAPSDAERFLFLDRAKSKADRLLKFDKALSPEQNAALQPLREKVGAFRAALEDQKVWGRAGEYQANLNSALKDHFRAQEALDSAFFAKARTPEELEAGRVVLDPKKVGSYLKQRATGAPEADRTAGILKSYVDNTKALLQHLEDSTYSELPSKVAEARSARDALGKFSARSEEAAKAVADRKTVLAENAAGEKAAQRATREHLSAVQADARQHERDVARAQAEYERTVAEAEKRSGQQLRWQKREESADLKVARAEHRAKVAEAREAFRESSKPGMAWALAEHLPLVGPLAKLSREREVISGLAKHAAKASDTISRGVRQVLASSGARKAEDTAIGALSSHHWGSPGSRGESRGAAAARHAMDLAQLQADPQGTAAKLTASTASLARHAPDTAAQVQLVTSRAASFLAAQAPKSPLPPSPFKGGPKWEAPQSDVERFERVSRAVHQPLSLLDDLHGDRLSPDAVDAVRTVYPSLHQALVKEVLGQIPGLTSTPPPATRLGLSLLTGVPLEPSLRDMTQLQTNYAGGPPGPSGGAPKVNQKGLSKLGMADRSGTPLTGAKP